MRAMSPRLLAQDLSLFVETALSNSGMALAAAVGVMLVSAGTANYLPARRASAIEPTQALRSE